ncbi:hypothetical protein [Occultella gossypii]|uniref:Uncharacterized protein n=1 Tax=Occultella gossypii TaxID=2800820 RepID=A0ABS7SE21_9MICO|nr:hypothetical protein [Occultella gossypii]MBZ2197994.1 hypothetical protein [Occultella gossypii]
MRKRAAWMVTGALGLAGVAGGSIAFVWDPIGEESLPGVGITAPDQAHAVTGDVATPASQDPTTVAPASAVTAVTAASASDPAATDDESSAPSPVAQASPVSAQTPASVETARSADSAD